MEPDDYFNKLLDQVNTYYTYNITGSLMNSGYINTNDLVTDKDLFTSQSIVDLFDDLSADLNNNTNTKSNTVNNRSAKKETNEFDISKCIGNGARLVKEFGYTDMQVQITHNRHHEKIQTLLSEFYKLTITDGPNKELYETYFKHLVYFNATFKTSQWLTLTKQGMQYCNDIYNWYESIKGHIDKFGA